MKQFTTLVLIILIIGVSGCTGPATPAPQDPVTLVAETIPPTEEVIETPVPEELPTEVPTELPTEVPAAPTQEPFIYIPDPEPTYEPTPEPGTRNITEGMVWIEYTNNTDFAAKYPEGWLIINKTFPSWSNRIVSTPEIYKQEGRDVTFRSYNNLTWFNARVYDFIVPGNHKLNQNLQPVKEQITRMCPDVSGDSAISNHRLFVDDYKYTIMDFDVRIPITSNCSPLEYSERTFVTYNHLYVLDFVTTEAPLESYKDVRDTMMKYIVPEPPASYLEGLK